MQRQAGYLDRARVAAREAALAPATAQQLAALRDRRGYPLSDPELALAIDSYIHLHGFTAMEVFRQLRPITRTPTTCLS